MPIIDLCPRNGRPGSQAVSEKFSVDWGTYMSSHNDVVYVKLDVRGAKGQGSRSLYRHLGGVEVQDQITVLRSATELSCLSSRVLDSQYICNWCLIYIVCKVGNIRDHPDK
jgi:hypothetical protein